MTQPRSDAEIRAYTQRVLDALATRKPIPVPRVAGTYYWETAEAWYDCDLLLLASILQAYHRRQCRELAKADPCASPTRTDSAAAEATARSAVEAVFDDEYDGAPDYAVMDADERAEWHDNREIWLGVDIWPELRDIPDLVMPPSGR
jgi:hypothetical protein